MSESLWKKEFLIKIYNLVLAGSNQIWFKIVLLTAKYKPNPLLSSMPHWLHVYKMQGRIHELMYVDLSFFHPPPLRSFYYTYKVIVN